MGLTQNRAVIHRWILAQADRPAITRKCELMAGVADEQRYLETILNRYTLSFILKTALIEVSIQKLNLKKHNY